MSKLQAFITLTALFILAAIILFSVTPYPWAGATCALVAIFSAIWTCAVYEDSLKPFSWIRD